MNDFTASNGMVFRAGEDGSWRWVSGYRPAKVTEALRELFRAERDAELGRWRWPENPDYVVYRTSERRAVRVLRESTAIHFDYTDNGAWSTVPSDYEAAARAYFDAHPERKPWHDAKEGEVWLVRPTKAIGGGEYPAIFQAGAFRDHGGYWEAHDITDARRIWPEGDAS